MAFRQQDSPFRQHYLSQPAREDSTSPSLPNLNDRTEESQEWILFSPSPTASATNETRTDRTPPSAGLSHASEFGSLATRPGQLAQNNSLDDALTEDGELDSLDEGLQEFREPSIYRSSSNQANGTVLPTHDGLGTFPASSTSIQAQLWQHELYNPKRKHEGSHRRRSSLQRRLDTIEELELQISEEKRMRIEQWRMEQSQALLDEIEKETRKRARYGAAATQSSDPAHLRAGGDQLGAAVEKAAPPPSATPEPEEGEPFWRRMTRRFIRDVFGIDDPLLSVIVGETLPEDIYAIANLNIDHEEIPAGVMGAWPDRLLRRIARELALLVHTLSPHPAASAAASSPFTDHYAGIPVPEPPAVSMDLPAHSDHGSAPKSAPLFPPTMQHAFHHASWGLDEESLRDAGDAPAEVDDDAERLRREREYWERELDVKMVFRFLKGRFSSANGARRRDASPRPAPTRDDESLRRADVIRRHHPLVARAHHRQHQPSLARLRRESSLRTSKRAPSSCASEGVRSAHRSSVARSAGSSSRNYWDIGGSIGSGSAFASGGMMGAWGEV